MRWTIILPVKRLPLGKSRLRPAGDTLVLAIALDTVGRRGRVRRRARGDAGPAVRAAVTALGASWVDDPGPRPERRHPGRRELGRAGRPPGGAAGRPAGAAPSRPVSGAFGGPVRTRVPARPRRHRHHAAHRSGRRRVGPGLRARVGRGPRRLPAAAELAGDFPSLRLDVDTQDDLIAATALGLGPRTAAALDGYPAPYAGDGREL